MVFLRSEPSIPSEALPVVSSVDDILPVEEFENAPDDPSGDYVELAPSSSFRKSTPQQSSTSQQHPSLSVYKFGIMERLSEAVATKVVHASNQSTDLLPLMKRFDIFRKKIRQMIIVAKTYHQSMITLDLDRIQVR
jgi:hypothetical protein